MARKGQKEPSAVVTHLMTTADLVRVLDIEAAPRHEPPPVDQALDAFAAVASEMSALAASSRADVAVAEARGDRIDRLVADNAATLRALVDG